MSDVISTAVEALSAKVGDGGFAGSAKFVIEGEGSILVDGDGVRADDSDADVTLTAEADTFEAILSGDIDPTVAFMSGKLTIDGDMGMAMQLGNILS